MFNYIKSFFTIQNNVINVDFLMVRSTLAFITAFIITFCLLAILISALKKHKCYQPIRNEGPISHVNEKKKIPTLGGLACCLGLLFSTLLFCDISDTYVIAVLAISMLFGLIGLIDDLTKIFLQNTSGFKGATKLVIETFICGLILLWLILNDSPITNEPMIFIPFLHNMLYIGILLIPFIVLVIIGSANAVNLTDGLDGLVIVPVILSALAFLIIAIFSAYGPNAHFITTINFNNPSELAVMCSAVIGTGIAFLIYNRYPARIIMGDVGSLMYGAFLGATAVMLRYELFFAIIGMLFVLEAISDIIQVITWRFFGKKVFKMAPLHHHFEQSGWKEKSIVLIFWSFSIICLVIGFFGIINF